MATDMVTSPVTPRGMWLYGALIGILTVIIRYSGGLPEGVMYAILIGNAATPLIERITQPRGLRHGPHQGDQSMSAPDSSRKSRRGQPLAHATPAFTCCARSASCPRFAA